MECPVFGLLDQPKGDAVSGFECGLNPPQKLSSTVGIGGDGAAALEIQRAVESEHIAVGGDLDRIQLRIMVMAQWDAAEPRPALARDENGESGAVPAPD